MHVSPYMHRKKAESMFSNCQPWFPSAGGISTFLLHLLVYTFYIFHKDYVFFEKLKSLMLNKKHDRLLKAEEAQDWREEEACIHEAEKWTLDR